MEYRPDMARTRRSNVLVAHSRNVRNLPTVGTSSISLNFCAHKNRIKIETAGARFRVFAGDIDDAEGQAPETGPQEPAF